MGSSKDKACSRARRSFSVTRSLILTTSFQVQNDDGADSPIKMSSRRKGRDSDEIAPGWLVLASGHVSKKIETKSVSRNPETMIRVLHCDCASAYLSS